VGKRARVPGVLACTLVLRETRVMSVVDSVREGDYGNIENGMAVGQKGLGRAKPAPPAPLPPLPPPNRSGLEKTQLLCSWGSLNRYHHRGARFPRLDPWARIGGE
jgi:hypothetical protein